MDSRPAFNNFLIVTLQERPKTESVTDITTLVHHALRSLFTDYPHRVGRRGLTAQSTAVIYCS